MKKSAAEKKGGTDQSDRTAGISVLPAIHKISLFVSLFLCMILLQTGQARANEAAEKEVFHFLTVQMELPPAAACGIMSNIAKESDFAADVTGPGGAYGICQWMGSRKTELISYCEEKNLNYKSLNGQLHFLEFEVRRDYQNLYGRMKALPDTAEGAYQAGYLWCYEFERPANIAATSEYRGNYAREYVWPKYGTAVASLKAKDTQAGISLAWTTVYNGSYAVYRSVQKTKGYKKVGQAAAGVKTYTDKSAAAGTVYYYQLRVISGGKVSAAASSNTVSCSHVKHLSDKACTVEPIADRTYKGKKQKPAVSISYNGTKLTEGTDFTAEYTDNVNTGTASITLTGIGDYSGTRVVHFQIVKANQRIREISETVFVYTTSKRTVTARSVGEITLSVADPSIAVVSGGKLKLKRTGTTTLTLTAAETKNYKQAKKTVKLTVLPAKPRITGLKQIRKTSSYQRFNVSWTAPGTPDGVEIQCTTSPVFKKWAKKVRISGAAQTSAVVQTIRKYKKWNFRIRSYKVIDGVTYYSKWSNVQKVG